MHSRKKRVTVPTEEEKQAEKARLDKISQLHSQVFEHYSNQDYSEEANALLQKAMGLSPDVYSFLNYRRKYLLATITPETEHKVYMKELDLLNRILKESPKSYTLWYHRQWILERCKDDPEILANELALCDYMLSRDHRNFHCWNYRTWVVKLTGQRSLEQEMEFTMVMIKKDFSNFSAWHYRTKLLKQMYPREIPLDFLHTELHTLKNGYFTCPNDQSIWNYHRWLLDQVTPIKITGVWPKKYSDPPNYFLVGFSRKIVRVNEESVEFIAGGAKITGTWSPYQVKNTSYIWKFEPTAPIQGEVAIECKSMQGLVDINGFDLVTSIKFKYVAQETDFVLESEGCDNTDIIEQELAGIEELFEIEEDDVIQAMLRKAQLLEMLSFACPSASKFEQIKECYGKLTELDPRHKVFYAEVQTVFEALATGVTPPSPTKSQQLLALLVGISEL